MLLSKCCHLTRLPVSVNYHKKSLTTFPNGQFFENFLKVVQRNSNFINVHGPVAEEVVKDIDLTDKTCLITGANSGIGLELTRCLSARNCNVLMACRNPYAAGLVKKIVGDNSHLLKFSEINLASLKSVKNCSDEIIRDHSKIDMVILNAGVFGIPWSLTEDMLETVFQVNFLSQLYLLMNIDKNLASDARVVFMSSESHRNIRWNLQNTLTPTEDMISLPKNKYTSIKAYNVSKLCGILAMHYLGYRWLNTGKKVFCAHPGTFVKTGLCRNWWPYEILYTFMQPFSKNICQAASTPIYCATSPELQNMSAIYVKDLKRCEESDLAMDSHLSFRLNDLTRDILRDRVGGFDVIEKSEETKPEIKTFAEIEKFSKEQLEDELMSSYSG